jgi:hypothetical protein
MGSGGSDAAQGGFHPANIQKWPFLERIIATIVTGQAQEAIKNIANSILLRVILSAPG